MEAGSIHPDNLTILNVIAVYEKYRVISGFHRIHDHNKIGPNELQNPPEGALFV
jgi:hypothetical protein